MHTLRCATLLSVQTYARCFHTRYSISSIVIEIMAVSDAKYIKKAARESFLTRMNQSQLGILHRLSSNAVPLTCFIDARTVWQSSGPVLALVDVVNIFDFILQLQQVPLGSTSQAACSLQQQHESDLALSPLRAIQHLQAARNDPSPNEPPHP